MSKVSAAYNPMSFYNGGVWPFDTAIIANGIKKHGYAQESNRIALGLFEAALALRATSGCPSSSAASAGSRARGRSRSRWPARHTPRPAARFFLVLQSMLGIYAQADENVVYVHNPVLPRWIGELGLRNLHDRAHDDEPALPARAASQTGFSVRDKQGPGRIVVVE